MSVSEAMSAQMDSPREEVGGLENCGIMEVILNIIGHIVRISRS